MQQSLQRNIDETEEHLWHYLLFACTFANGASWLGKLTPSLMLLLVEQHALKNVNNCRNTNIYFYFKTSGCQNSNLYLHFVHFFNTSVN
jgi:hypothetical protein